jgi:gamma-glutamyltranspeptidase
MTNELIAAAARLADALRAENEALAALDLKRAAAMLPEKTEAAAAFTALGNAMRPGQEPEARDLAARLRDLAEENRRLLERAIAVQGRVLETIASAARAQASAPRYGARGALAPDRKAAAFALSARA